MNEGNNQYAPMAGVLALRKAIANKFEFLYGSSYHPETEITVTAGATQAIYTIISTFIKQDDEVIIFRPAYDCYEPTVQLNGGKIISIQLAAPNYTIHWDMVKSKITDRTKMIIVNTPHNPSGAVLSKKDMLALEQLVSNTNIVLLSDEVYEHITFDEEKHHSACCFPELKKRSFIVASFGKTFHNTGWKMGYCCAPKELMEEFQKVHQFNVFCVNRPIQHALAEYLSTKSNYTMLPGFYQQKRDLFLNEIKGSRFKITPAKGTYFQVLDYSNISEEADVDMAVRLTKESKIAAIPLSVFNDEQLDLSLIHI